MNTPGFTETDRLIAETLTRPQRRALLWLDPQQDEKGGPGRMGSALASLRKVEPRLVSINRLRHNNRFGYSLTPVGQGVRSALLQEPDHDAPQNATE